MAYFKIEENSKGLVAKIQVHTKDIKTGKPKIITKRVYNDKNLTEAKFEKYIEGIQWILKMMLLMLIRTIHIN